MIAICIVTSATTLATSQDPYGLEKFTIDEKAGTITLEITVGATLGGETIKKGDKGEKTIEEFVKTANEMINKTNGIYIESTELKEKKRFRPQIKITWDPDEKKPDATIAFGIGPKDYGIGASYMKSEAWKGIPDKKRKEELAKKVPEAFHKLIPGEFVMHKSYNVEKFLRSYFGLKTDKDDVWEGMLGRQIEGKDVNQGALMLPRYYQKWLDHLNKADPKAKFKLYPDLSEKGAGRRFFLRYFFGDKIDLLNDDQLDLIEKHARGALK